MPVKIAFELLYSFARDGVSNDYRRLFKDVFGLINRSHDFIEIMSTNFLHMPVPSLPFRADRIQRHDVFGESIDLDVIAIDNRNKISQLFFPRKHGRFPALTAIVLAIAHQTINVTRRTSPTIDPIGQSHSYCLGQA